MKKVFILSLIALPFMAFAVNDVQINGTTNFDMLTSDTATQSYFFATSGQATDFNIQSNYTDITVDNLSSVTLQASTSGVYFKISKQSGSNDYSISSPSCPTTTINISGTGLTSVLRLETVTTYNCVAPTSSTTTPPTPTPAPPGAGGFIYTPSVTNFVAKQSTDDVLLSWNLPSEIDFSLVKIVRSTSFFPNSPSDGTIVYSGNGVSAVDFNLNYGTTYYYSAFSFNKNGVASNPLIAWVFLAGGKTPEATTTIPFYPSYPGEEYSTGTETFPGEIVIPSGTSTPAEIGGTSSTTVSIKGSYTYWQNGEKLSVSSSTLNVNINTNLVITSDTKKFNTTIKTIILTIVDPADTSKSDSYLFSPDEEGKTLKLVVPNFTKSGKYKYTITAYDQSNKPVSVTRGYFNVMKETISFKYFVFLFGIIILLLLIILLIIWLSWREYQKRERERSLNTYKGF